VLDGDLLVQRVFKLLCSPKFSAVLTAAVILFGAVTQAQEQTGRLHIVLVKAGTIMRAHGAGSLFYNGKRFRLEIGGINLNAMGTPRVDLVGDALNLRTRGDIIGIYHAADAGLGLASAKTAARLQNANGVTIALQPGNEVEPPDVV